MYLRSNVIVGVCIALSSAVPLKSQALLCVDTTNVVIGSVYASTDLNQLEAMSAVVSTRVIDGGTSGVVNWMVTILAGKGSVSFSIAPETIAFSGDCSVMDRASASHLFALIDDETVRLGIALGYANASEPLRVWHPACVSRYGNGASTAFRACGTECTFGEFIASADSSHSELSLSDHGPDACSVTACEPTCPGLADLLMPSGLN